LCLAAMSPIEGRTQGLQREADKAESIKQIMAKRTFEMSPVVRKNSKAFCEAFLLDFRLQKSIEFIEPVAKADSYDNPVWETYRRRCPDVPIFDSYECEPKIYDAIMAEPPAERQRQWKTACRHYRGTANFKLFLVDINNNAQDGKEHVFYYERAQGPLNRPDAKLNYGNGGYSVVDLDRCELKGGAEAHDPYSYFYQRPLENYSGIIRYNDKHYVFDLYELAGRDRDPNNPNYRLHLNGYSTFGRETTPRLGPICTYSTLGLKSK
jgi:hypothetical protein